MSKAEALIRSGNAGDSLIRRMLSLLAIQVIKFAVNHVPFPEQILECVRYGCRWYAGVNQFEIMVDNHCWSYLGGGAGEVILFLHGFGADKDRFGIFLPAFRPYYRVIVPDLPGFGESSGIDSESYDIPSQVKRFDRFIEALGLDRFHLFGLSMGGYISGCYACEHPERVLSLVMMDTAGVKSRIPSDAWRRYTNEGRNVLLFKTEEQVDELMSFLFHQPPNIPHHFKTFFAQEGARNYNWRNKLMDDIINGGLYHLEGCLSEIAAETLVFWGENDRMVHPSTLEKLEKGIRNCRSKIFNACGHLPFIEKPVESKVLYKQFLDSLK
jgi:pimeloyl-ACP methyl ester carboxylesterase